MNDIDFRPTTPPRPTQVYLSWSLFKALGYVSRKTRQTREDIVEIVLNTFVSQKHPEIAAWIEKREVEEKAFRAGLKPTPAPFVADKNEVPS
jgi:hypothetical protein